MKEGILSTKESEKPGSSMKSLRASLQVFLAFSEDRRDFAVAELAALLGYNRSHVSKIVDALVEAGLLMRDLDSRRIRVGPEAFAVGSRFVNFDHLSNEAVAVMRSLAARTGYGLRLCIPRGQRMLYIAGVAGERYVNYGWQVGKWLHMHSTSVGRVALAFMPKPAAQEILAGDLEKMTEATVVDRKKLMRMLETIRTNGWCAVRGETTLGMGALAVPIFGREAQAIAAMNLVFPSRLVSAAEEGPMIAALHEGAAELSHKMGCLLYPFGGHREPKQ